MGHITSSLAITSWQNEMLRGILEKLMQVIEGIGEASAKAIELKAKNDIIDKQFTMLKTQFEQEEKKRAGMIEMDKNRAEAQRQETIEIMQKFADTIAMVAGVKAAAEKGKTEPPKAGKTSKPGKGNGRPATDESSETEDDSEAELTDDDSESDNN